MGQFQEQDGFVKCNKSALDKNLHVLYFDLTKGPMMLVKCKLHLHS